MRTPIIALLAALSPAVQAEVKTQTINYTGADGSEYIGYYAYDDAIEGPRPAIVVVHEWWGLNDYAKSRARDLAALGYSALAIDMYGQGQNTHHPKDAMAFMQAATASAETSKQRFLAGYETLKAQPFTDSSRIGAIGYCFGGKVVLDMARQGLPLAGVVSFHGSLTPAIAAAPGVVTAKVLVEHGELDSMITQEQIRDFKAEMDQAGVDYEFVSLPGAKHGFSNPNADSHQAHGLDLAYQKEADDRSWSDMQAFFKRLF